ncbi:hypothetical protein GW7_07570 [Heterocephalus glaber]|uniref:Kinesin-like KIF1-type domain-containing protein n=1 Tax=Heterocephalus glaber TaxID=10181 RepID=G5ALP7_HETGA|nr:hypothetical protein GW7_07570 [Heterocephalus glaber]
MSPTAVTRQNQSELQRAFPVAGFTVSPKAQCLLFSFSKMPKDRIILGSNSAYLYIGFPSERGCEDLSRFDYDFFQLERAAQKDGSLGLGTTMTAIPLRGLGLESAASDTKFQPEGTLLRQLIISVWIWSKVKFINRKFLMEELYQHFLDREDSPVAQEDDPFWDPVEVIHLGSAHIWLQSLAYCMQFEDQVEFLNCDGLEEAVLHIHITPCSPAGQAQSEEDVVTDPLELLGKRIDFQIHTVHCLGIKWLKEDAKRGIQISYRMYDLPITLYTKPVWKTVNPQIEETVQFTAFSASQKFLNYLQTNALIADLWGLQGTVLTSFAWYTIQSEAMSVRLVLQKREGGRLVDLGKTRLSPGPLASSAAEGCAELRCSQLDLIVTGEGHIMLDTKKLSSVKDTGLPTSNQTLELYLKTLKLEQETELLRNINRTLRRENVFLKESLKKTGSGQQGETAAVVVIPKALYSSKV